MQSFITEQSDPGITKLQSGNWNFELWASVSNVNAGFYITISIYNQITGALTLISPSTPSIITFLDTPMHLYLFSIPILVTTILATDRIVVKLYFKSNHGSIDAAFNFNDSTIGQVTTTISNISPILNALNFTFGNFTPLHATSYFFGDIPIITPNTVNNSGRTEVLCPYTGRVTSVNICNYSTGIGDTSTNTFRIRNNTTGITQLITSSFIFNDSYLLNYVLSPPLVVNKNDNLTIIWESQINGTLPSGLSMRLCSIIEYP